MRGPGDILSVGFLMKLRRRTLLSATAVPFARVFGQAGDWIDSIRRDHPRLFFNADSWPAIAERARTVNRDHFEAVRRHAEGPAPKPYWDDLKLPPRRPGSLAETRDWGNQLMSAAFVHRVEPSEEQLKRIRDMLWASLDYYHASYEANLCVNWYSTSRVSWVAALDWVWNDLDPEERIEMGRSMLRHAHETVHKPGVVRRNSGDHRGGYYGGRNVAWFAGLALLGEGADDGRALELLREGHSNLRRLLEHRSAAAGDDGGAASATLSYALNAYPWVEWNFLYTWQSATGEDLAPKWPYIGLFPNYVVWNWLPGGLEFGYGDSRHLTNEIESRWLYTHLSQAMHFYARSHPRYAALAAYPRERVGGGYIATQWSVYPFLMTRLEEAPPPLAVESLPPARHFESMGQTFMRSGDGPDDTYALFACGGILSQHRHYDANHFAIFKKGHLALDSGTRVGTTDNLQNYFAQTVAHNCVLIKMPGEAPSNYWNGTVYGQAGGQYQALGSKVIAFETGPHFTYAAGDATATYNPAKCRLAVRQFVFLPPDHFVVLDRVVSTDAAYAKRWLLHHANEPVVEGNVWRSDQNEGRLFCRTLLPADAVLEKVGGPGKEFLADGVNYSIFAGPSEQAKRTLPGIEPLPFDEVPELVGRWRMEVKPGAAREGDVFLHVIEAGGQGRESMVPVALREEAGMAGASLAVGRRTIQVDFRTGGETGGHIRIEEGGRTLVDRALTSEVMPQSGLAGSEG